MTSMISSPASQYQTCTSLNINKIFSKSLGSSVRGGPKALLKSIVEKMPLSKNGIDLDGVRWDAQENMAIQHGVSSRTIRNWERALEKIGMIQIKLFNNGFKRTRTIRLSSLFKSIFKLALAGLNKYAKPKKSNDSPTGKSFRSEPEKFSDELIPKGLVNTHSHTIGKIKKSSSDAVMLGHAFLRSPKVKWVDYKKYNPMTDRMIGKFGLSLTAYMLRFHIKTHGFLGSNIDALMSPKTSIQEWQASADRREYNFSDAEIRSQLSGQY